MTRPPVVLPPPDAPLSPDPPQAFEEAPRSRWRAIRDRLFRRSWLPRGSRAGERAHASTVPALARAERADFDVDGALRVRTRDAQPGDLAAMARHLGRSIRRSLGDPDVVVCFVDELTPHVLEHVRADLAFGDDGVYALGRASARPLAHARLGEPWGSASIVCRHGLGRVPLLSATLDLAALRRGWIPLRAQTWSARGARVLVVRGEGSRPAPASGMADCLQQVPEGRLLVSPDGRTALRMGKTNPVLEGAPAPGPDAADGSQAFDAIALLDAHERAEIAVEPIDADAAAGRIAAGVALDLRESLAWDHGHRGRLAGPGWPAARMATGVAARLAREATRWKACYAVRYPETCAPDAVLDAIARVATRTAIRTGRAPILPGPPSPRKEKYRDKVRGAGVGRAASETTEQP